MKAHHKGNGNAAKPVQPAPTNTEKKLPSTESKPETLVSTLLSMCALHMCNLFK